MTPGRPNWSRLPTEEKLALTQLYVEGERDTLKERADQLNINLVTLERQIRTYKRDHAEIAQYLATTTVFPVSGHPRNEDYLILNQDSAVIVGDIEIPDHDNWMLKAALLVAMRRNIKTLIYNGDIIATDQSSLTTWDTVWKEANEISYEEALRITEHIMAQYGQWFTEQYFITGNHDVRINKVSAGEVHLGMLLKTTPTQFSRYGYLYMKTNRGWIYICHPVNYSIHAASKLGNDLWATHFSPEKTKCHVVLGHTHLDQAAWSPDGLNEIHSSGCMRRQASYADLSASTHRAWQRGFLVIDHGYFKHFTEYGTDWKQELGEFYTTLPEK